MVKRRNIVFELTVYLNFKNVFIATQIFVKGSLTE